MKTREDIRRTADRLMILSILRDGKELNDRIGALRYGLFSVHQRIADLEKEGYIIDHIKDSGKLKTFRLVADPTPIIPSNEFSL